MEACAELMPASSRTRSSLTTAAQGLLTAAHPVAGLRSLQLLAFPCGSNCPARVESRLRQPTHDAPFWHLCSSDQRGNRCWVWAPMHVTASAWAITHISALSCCVCRGNCCGCNCACGAVAARPSVRCRPSLRRWLSRTSRATLFVRMSAGF